MLIVSCGRKSTHCRRQIHQTPSVKQTKSRGCSLVAAVTRAVVATGCVKSKAVFTVPASPARATQAKIRRAGCCAGTATLSAAVVVVVGAGSGSRSCRRAVGNVSAFSSNSTISPLAIQNHPNQYSLAPLLPHYLLLPRQPMPAGKTDLLAHCSSRVVTTGQQHAATDSSQLKGPIVIRLRLRPFLCRRGRCCVGRTIGRHSRCGNDGGRGGSRIVRSVRNSTDKSCNSDSLH